MASRLIWFLLSDPDGQPFKGASADKVSVSSLADVVDFRKAVKVEYSNKLALVDAGDLLVYKNKAAFDKRNATEGKEEPLKSSRNLFGLGGTEDEALIVVVPLPSAMQEPWLPNTPHWLRTESPPFLYSIELTDSPNSLQAFQKYVTLGDKLKDTAEIREIFNVIDYIESNRIHTPFLFIEGSSGTGKTQSAFALMKALEGIRQVFYLISSTGSSFTEQSIYKRFENPSTGFLKCVDKDLELIKHQPFVSDHTAAEALYKFDGGLYTFGFIKELITKGYTGRDIAPYRLTGRALKEYLDSLSSRPIFVLDEYQPLSVGNANLDNLRLMRNIFRSVGIVPITMGTDSTAANLVEYSGRSRSGNLKIHWCSIVWQLPKFIMEFPVDLSLDWFRSLLIHSRPLFAQKALEYLEMKRPQTIDAKLLEEICVYIASDASESKNIFLNDFGLCGQLALFLNAHYAAYSGEEAKKSPLIHHHFAKLAETDNPINLAANLYKISDPNNPIDWQPWTPVTVMPSPNEDCLLHLSFTGIPGFAALQNRDRCRITFAAAQKQFRESPGGRSLKLSFNNSQQASNDGMTLEALAVGAACLASHMKGFSGCPLAEFVQQMFREILEDEIAQINGLDGFTADLQRIGTYSAIVPFLAPPNQEWPEFLKSIPGALFGRIERTVNFDKIDASIECRLSSDDAALTNRAVCIECKDYREPIKLPVMKQMLERIRPESKLHIVVTNKLQKSYFHRKEKFEDFINSRPQIGHCIFYRVYRVEGTLKFEKGISGLTNASANAQRIVLFFERY